MEERQRLHGHLPHEIVDQVVFVVVFPCRSAVHVRPCCICWCHKLHLITFHSISPASDGLHWVIRRKPSGIKEKEVGMRFQTGKAVVRSWKEYNCLGWTEFNEKRAENEQGQV